MPKGIPTPRPIFCCLDSPSLLAGGEAGRSDALGVELALAGLVEIWLEPVADEESTAELLREALETDLVDVENVRTEDAIAEDCAALLGTGYETEGVAWGDCQTLVDRGHSHSLCVGVACAPLVCGGVGSSAVSGPNSLTR